jgi:glycosyltransferase involved in cell wall biosynthesis
MRTVVIIPALNEEKSIARVLQDVPGDLVEAVVVVDNGSTDSTQEEAGKAGAHVVEETVRGYGRACLRGIECAARWDPETIVFLDGDFSDSPEEMSRLLAPIMEDRADLVIGSRTLGNRERGALLPQARLGNYIACVLMRLIWGVRFTDLGPFRAIRYSTLKHIEMQDQNFGWTVEMQIRAAREGFRCMEVPVSYRKRIGKSKVTGTLVGTARASYTILKTIFSEAFRSKGLRKKGSGSRASDRTFTPV